jgi:hypothetical protein
LHLPILSGYETCPKRTQGCTAACLNTAGRGGMFKKGESTNMLFKKLVFEKLNCFSKTALEFMNLLVKDIDIRKAIKQAEKKSLIPVFRLNGTLPIIAFEKYEVLRNGNHIQIFSTFPEVINFTIIPRFLVVN